MATSLLNMALALLIAASGPNVPAGLRAQAISVATIAIQYSQQQTASTTIAAAIPVKPATTTVQTGPGYWGDDGCFYAAPVGRIMGGIKVSCKY